MNHHQAQVAQWLVIKFVLIVLGDYCFMHLFFNWINNARSNCCVVHNKILVSMPLGYL